MRRLGIIIVIVAALFGVAAVIARRQARPAAGPGGLAAVPPGVVMVAMPCYYPARTGFELVEEIRHRPKAASAQERLRGVLEELHRPPASAAAVPLFPGGTSPRAVFLSAEGMACVDETAAALDREAGPRDEFVLLRALARSVLRSVPEARSLVVLVDGAPRARLALHLSAAGRYLLPRQAPPAR